MALQISIDTCIDDVLKITDTICQAFVGYGFQAITHHLATSTILNSIFAIYMFTYLYQVLYDDIPYAEGARHLSKFTVAFLLAMNWDIFHKYIYLLFTDYPLYISKILVDAFNQSDLGTLESVSLNDSFIAGMKFAKELLKQMTINPATIFLCLLSAICIGLTTIIFTVGGLGLVLMSKFFLSINLAIAPYFIFMYLFNGTRGLSQSWVQHCLNYGLIPVFVGIVLLLLLTIAKISLNGAVADSEGGPSFTGILVYVACSLSALVVLKNIRQYVGSLTSSMAQAALNRTAKSAAQSATNTITGGRERVQSAHKSYQQRQQKLHSEVRERALDRTKKEQELATKRRRGGI